MLINARLGHLGISAGTSSPLMYLAHNRDATQDDIAMRMCIDKAAIARAFRKLENEGIVRRMPDEMNRRKVRLLLTEKGENIVHDSTAIADGIDREITAGLTANAHYQFVASLRTVAQTIVHLK